MLLKCLCQTLLAFPCVGPHVILSYTCGVHFDVLTLSLCPLCYPTQRFGLEDGVSRRWHFVKTVSMLGWCTPGQLPEGMETLLCWNSNVILCLDPLVIFVICNRFCIKHCNVSLLLSHV